MNYKNAIIRVLSLVATIGIFSTVILSVNAEEYKSENNYLAYLQQFNNSEYPNEDLTCNLNGQVLENGQINARFMVNKTGFYGLGLSYRALDAEMANVEIGIKFDGEYPYSKMSDLEFPRMWMDKTDGIVEDGSGNQIAPQQELYGEYFYNEAIDKSVEVDEKIKVYLTEGEHSVSILFVSGKLQLEYIKFYNLNSPKEYSAPQNKDEYYNGKPITLEGESATVKSSYFLVDKSDTSAVAITPQSASKNLINYVGGANWKTVGDKLVWETPEIEAGYYKLGFSYRQNSNVGGKSYRILKIDGEVPFKEAENVGFKYGDNWQRQFFSDDNNAPYLIYLSKGKHQISLTVTAAEMADVQRLLSSAVSKLGSLYIDITKITGETVDIYRDYQLFSQITNMEDRLNSIRSDLEIAGKTLLEVTGEDSGSNYSVIMNMVQTINQMLDNRFEAHRYKDYYYTNYCSVSSVLQELREMPLDIDKITLNAVRDTAVAAEKNFFEQAVFSFKRFAVSFIRDYSSVSGNNQGDNSITVWVNWGRDQAQVLDSLLKRSFSPTSGVDVNLKLVNATVIQAVLSGNGPDCFLQMTRSEPVNLAMRGVLYDLNNFGDIKAVLSRFQNGAQIPYEYKNGLYAIPDTQSFYVMFYRKDILEEYGLTVPETWEEFDLTAKLLMKNNLSVYLPITASTDVAQANLGIGSGSILPSMLLQNNVPIYERDGKSTNLLSAEAMSVFGKWTDYYTKLKFPKTLDFYNRFRTGTTPLGIQVYTQYTTFKAAASEIEGAWGIKPIPGTRQDDGSVSHTVSGGGTGCVILNSSANKQGAWEFLKWWTSKETQLIYSNDLEAILGPTGRVALSNIEALSELSWDKEQLNELLTAWENVEEIPEYPGSYYVSRSIYQAYWNVVNSNKNSKDMLMKYGKEADDEIARKWKQYTDRRQVNSG